MRLAPSSRRVRSKGVKALEKARSKAPVRQVPPGLDSPDWSLDVRRYYRVVLANWPDEWRERWGYRANELQDTGMSWREAEVQAFIEVWNARRVGKPLAGF